jgi:diguanylate cyclase (GGDEF)-like protein/hemerythrin-like metal-binding protein/PAS domain S-box-containing protein
MTYQTEILPWSDNFCTGISSIDEQHRKLIDLINQLANSLETPIAMGGLDTIFTQLLEYADYHFSTEEALWSQYFHEDDLAKNHKTSHQRFFDTIQNLKSEANSKPFNQAPTKIISFLTHWLAYHILKDDMYMAHLVLAIQSGLSKEEAKLIVKEEMSDAMQTLIETILSLYDKLTSRTLLLMNEINKRQEADAKLLLAANVFKNTLDKICITDSDCNILDVNPEFCASYHLNYVNVIGENLKTLKPALVEQEFPFDLWETVRNKGCWAGEIRNRNNNGESESEWLTLSSIKDNQGQITHYVGVFSNVGPLFERQFNLETLANYDALTGLPNRVLLKDRLEQAIANSNRSHEKFVVLYLDLDGFKPVNDNFGHAGGDEVLCETANRFKVLVRSNDTVARVGGDVFVIILGHIKSLKDCKEILNRLLLDISKPIQIGNKVTHVTTSIGVAFYPNNGHDFESLLTAADHAMYVAKKSGKSRYHFA